MPPPDEDYLLAYVRALADAAHTQVIGLPYLHLEASTNHAVTKRSFFRRMRTQASSIPSRENDVRSFAADVSEYINRARRSSGVRRRNRESMRRRRSIAEAIRDGLDRKYHGCRPFEWRAARMPI